MERLARTINLSPSITTQSEPTGRPRTRTFSASAAPHNSPEPTLHDGDLGQQRQSWLERVANVRVHAATRERPRDRFDREKRFLLQPLTARP
jgi:hypothetical protein